MKTFLRRWWMLNCLFHFSRHHYGMIVPLDHFLEWMVGIDITNRVPSWYTGTNRASNFHNWFTERLYNHETNKKYKILPDTRIKELEQLIGECVDEDLVNRSGNNIRLSPKGLEKYSISYIFFGSEYGKKISFRIIEWGIPLIALWILSHLLDFTIQPK